METRGPRGPEKRASRAAEALLGIWGLWGPRGSFGTMEIPRKRRIVDDRNHEIVPSSDTTQENN